MRRPRKNRTRAARAELFSPRASITCSCLFIYLFRSERERSGINLLPFSFFFFFGSLPPIELAKRAGSDSTLIGSLRSFFAGFFFSFIVCVLQRRSRWCAHIERDGIGQGRGERKGEGDGALGIRSGPDGTAPSGPRCPANAGKRKQSWS